MYMRYQVKTGELRPYGSGVVFEAIVWMGNSRNCVKNHRRETNANPTAVSPLC